MTPEQKRRQEMLDYLQVLKYSHEAHALTEIERHGSEQYAQYEMDRAKLVDEIIKMVTNSVIPRTIDDRILTVYEDCKKMYIESELYTFNEFVGYCLEKLMEEKERQEKSGCL